MTDLHTIIHGCIAKDARCQKQLYNRYYNYAFKIAFRYIYSYERVPNIVNDSFVKLFHNLSRFKGLESAGTEPRLMGWLKKIVVNTAIDDLRQTKALPEIGDITEQVWEESNDSDNADNLLLYKEVISLAKRLPPSYRAVFNMHIIDGFSHREIADRLGISVGTSKSNLYKAKAELKALISKAAVFATEY